MSISLSLGQLMRAAHFEFTWETENEYTYLTKIYHEIQLAQETYYHQLNSYLM